MYRYFICISLFVINVDTIWGQVDLLRESEYCIKEGDKAMANFDFKAANSYYEKALSQIKSESRLKISVKLKNWEATQALLKYDVDAQYFDDITTSKLSQKEDIVYAHCLRAIGLLNNRELSEAKKILDEVNTLAKNIKHSKYYGTLSTYFGLIADIKEATELAFTALQIAQTENNISEQIAIYTQLSRYYLHESLYDESIKYTRKAIQLQIQNNKIDKLGANYEVLFYWFSLDSSKIDSTIWYGEKSLYYAKKTNDIYALAYQLLNMANLLTERDAPKSRMYINELNQLKSEYNFPNSLRNNLELYEGVYEMQSHQYTRAIEIFLKLIDKYSDQAKSEEYLCYEYLSYCYSQIGQFDKALTMEKLLRITKEKYESNLSRKQVLESELKFESLLKDKIILQNKITILNKEISEKKLTQLYNAQKLEHLSVQQQNLLAEKKNENLNNQIIITNQNTKLALNKKEMTILRQKEKLSTIILLSIIIGLLVSSIFFYLLRQKVKTLKNLEDLMQKAALKINNAKKQLELIDSKTNKNTTIGINNEFESIFDDFQTFENGIENIIDNTEKYKLKVHHEIKAPINRIQYLLNRLSSSEHLINNDKETLNSIQLSIENMKNSTEKILLLSKINHAAIEKSEVDLHEQLANVIYDLEFEYSTKIDYEVVSNKKLKVDPLLLNILWKNMISNSIKYAHPDRKLKIMVLSYTENKITSIEYNDNGLGLESDQLENYQNKRESLSAENSNKIGLTIIRNIVEKHGGTLTIKKITEGTTFSISLPFQD